MTWQKLNFNIIVASKGDLQRDIAASAIFKTHFSGLPPFYTRNVQTGKLGMLQRHCTRDYKIRVINRKTRELIGLKSRQRLPKDVVIEQWLGISIDEMDRVRISTDRNVILRYPLIELNMNRQDCVEWSKTYKMPFAPKSACKYCPFRNNEMWRLLREDKDDWQDAVRFDYFLRDFGLRDTHGKIYLHKKGVPLDQANLYDGTEEYGMRQECQGMCGL
jgi:hypothetical protein